MSIEDDLATKTAEDVFGVLERTIRLVNGDPKIALAIIGAATHETVVQLGEITAVFCGEKDKEKKLSVKKAIEISFNIGFELGLERVNEYVAKKARS